MADFLLPTVRSHHIVSAVPPRQSDVQRRLIASIDRKAQAASEEATPALLSLLGGANFTAGLHACCPSVADLDPPALLQLLADELRAAELTHNFNAVNSAAAWENE